MILQSLISTMREWTTRLIGTFRVRANDASARSELAHHLALAEEHFLRQGHPPAEAARLARLRCGQLDNALETMREQRGIPWLGAFTLDVKLGLRLLRKYLGLTLTGGIAMSVGFAMTIAVFAYFDIAIWSNKTPLEDGDRVIAIQLWDPENSRRSEIPVDDFVRWQRELGSLEDLGAFRTVQRDIVHGDGVEESVNLAEVTASGFRLARVPPLMGRFLTAADEAENAEPVVVIGHDEWRTRFNADPDVLGRTLRLGDRFHTIVGVMPEDFGFPINHQFWVPLQVQAFELVSAPPAGAVFGRLANGVSLEQAQAELSATGQLPSSSAADRLEPLRPTVLRYTQNFIDDTDPDDLDSLARNGRLVLFLVCLLLIPPCANIGMLVYARMVTRREEIALRAALGASRGRIVAQLFIEMLVLSTLAAGVALAAVGFLLTLIGGRFVLEIGRLPFWLELRPSADMMLFAAVLAILAAVVTGLLPALGATRAYARPGLNTLDARNRLRLGPVWSLLIIVQIAFTFAALPSAVELGWGVLRANVLGPGFTAEEYLTARLAYDADETDELLVPGSAARVRFDDASLQLLQRLEADPRVLSPVATASAVPGEGPWTRYFVADDASALARDSGTRIQIGVPMARTVRIDERYLDTFEIELLTGRRFDSGEHVTSSETVLVNATFAAEAFPDANPLGRRISFVRSNESGGNGGDSVTETVQIVGVIEDRPAHPYNGTVFHPAERTALVPVSIAFRAASIDGSLREELRDLAAAIDPSLQVLDVRTLGEVYDSQAMGNYLGGLAILAAGLSVLSLAAAGTYALMAFTVNQRKREIAIRMALGARRRKLLGGIFRPALRTVSAGALLGVVLAQFVQIVIPARMLGGLEIPGVLPAAAAFLICIGLAASFAPARRALATDPTESLKYE